MSEDAILASRVLVTDRRGQQCCGSDHTDYCNTEPTSLNPNTLKKTSYGTVCKEMGGEWLRASQSGASVSSFWEDESQARSSLA